MKSLVAVDPGKFHCGWALFLGGKLALCGFVRSPHERCDMTGMYCGHQILRRLIQAGVIEPLDEYIGESPEHRGINERANYNENILPLTRTSCGIAGVLSGEKTITHYPTPISWKGSIDGDKFIERSFTRLTLEEKKVMAICKRDQKLNQKDLTDVADAVCLGLWKLQRLEKWVD